MFSGFRPYVKYFKKRNFSKQRYLGYKHFSYKLVVVILCFSVLVKVIVNLFIVAWLLPIYGRHME